MSYIPATPSPTARKASRAAKAPVPIPTPSESSVPRTSTNTTFMPHSAAPSTARYGSSRGTL